VTVAISLSCEKKKEKSLDPSLNNSLKVQAYETLYIGTPSGLFVSYDSGASFKILTRIPVVSLAVEDGITMISDGTQAYTSSYGSTSWVSPQGGVPSGAILSVALVNGRSYIGASNGLAFSDDFINFNPYARVTSVDPYYTSDVHSCVTGLGDSIYVCTPSHGLEFYQGRASSTLMVIRNPSPPYFDNHVQSLAVDPLRNKLYIGTANALISGDLVYNMRNTMVQLGLEGSGFSTSQNINHIDVYKDTLCVATHSGISISFDSGSTWRTTNANQNGFSNDGDVTSCSVKNNFIIAGTRSGFSISTDGGQTWTTIHSGEKGITTNTITRVAIDRAAPNR
jgi:hypothetical protein